jgi:methyl-accepting chemotaxis protein
LPSGDLDVAIEGRNRGDEIGDMVRSVTVFRDNAAKTSGWSQEAESRPHALSAGGSRIAVDERARIEAEQKQALTALADVLAKLADGNLEEGMARGSFRRLHRHGLHL